MLPQTQMQKYLFKASATALRGSIRKPYFQELGNHLAISTYAGSAGRTESSNAGFSLNGDISYKFARTSIEAGMTNGIFTTTVVSQVEGLQIGKRLTVDEVICRLQSVFDSRTYPGNCLPRISPAGSTIRNLRIDGKVQELQLPPAFGASQDQVNAFFLGRHDQEASLQPGPIPEAIRVADLGTIYYAEWTWVHPQEQHQQRLTMLRLALGSDLGADVDVGDGSSDGTGWPPTS